MTHNEPSSRLRPRGLAHIWSRSLPLQVLGSTLIISLVVLLLTGLLLVRQSATAVVETKKQASVTEATGVYTFMQQQLRLPEFRDVAIDELLDRLAVQADEQAGQYRVVIQGPATSYVSSGIDPDSVPQALRDQVADNETGMFVVPTRVQYTDGEQSEPGWAIGATLVGPAGDSYPVYYVFPMSSEVQTLTSLQQAVVAAGAVLLIALALIATLVTVQVVRPVRRASQTARRLATGQLDERMPVHGTDDIASLALSMNEMASDLQQRIRELETLSMVQRRFVSDVSHELRTPMTTIKMASDVLYDAREELDPHARRTTELMSTEIERFDTMLSDLLEISRFDAGAAVLDVEEVDLAQLVEGEVEAQRAFADSQHTPLVVHSSGPAIVQGDPRRLRRIVRNLLSNAIEHGEHKPVDITIAGDNDSVAVSVRDRGVGFKADDATRVFDRFWRADPSRTRVIGGSGLGLSIALEDARLHRGWLSAWGRPGRGAQFRLTIPRTPDTVLTSSPIAVRPTDDVQEVP